MGDVVWAMRFQRRSAALRAEPVALSQAKPAAAIAKEFPMLSYRETLAAKGIPLEQEDEHAAHWVAGRLTNAQRRALEAFGYPPRCKGAKELGVSGSTLASLSDFRRGERDIAAPLMLVAREFDCDGTPFWDITGFGLKVRDTLSDAETWGAL